MSKSPVIPEGADDIGSIDAQTFPDHYTKSGKLKSIFYEAEMERLQEQLVLLQYWIQTQGLKVLVIFEGRGSAGKGGVIKRITERTSPRTRPGCRAAQADRAPAHAVVLPAVRRAPPRGRRDGDVRPQLVQPLERRVGDGLLHGGGAPGVPAELPRSSSGCWCGPGSSSSSTGSRSRSRSSASASRRGTPSRSSAGSCPTWTSPSTSSTSATRWRRTRRSSTPTSSRRRGTSYLTMTRRPPASTASTTCCQQFDVRRRRSRGRRVPDDARAAVRPAAHA